MALSDLVVETETPGVDSIADSISPYYEIHVPEYQLERTDAFDSLDTRERIIAALFALELRAELSESDWEGATVTELGDAMGCGWDQYGFYSILRGQEQDRVIARTRGGLYRVPGVWVDDAIDILSEA